MYALLTQGDHPRSWTLRVLDETDKDLETGTDVLRVSYPLALGESAKTRGALYAKASWTLFHHGFSYTGRWQEQKDGAHRMSVAQFRTSAEPGQDRILLKDALKDMVDQLADWRHWYNDPAIAGSLPKLAERAAALTDLCNWLTANPRPSVAEFLNGQGLSIDTSEADAAELITRARQQNRAALDRLNDQKKEA